MGRREGAAASREHPALVRSRLQTPERNCLGVAAASICTRLSLCCQTPHMADEGEACDASTGTPGGAICPAVATISSISMGGSTRMIVRIYTGQDGKTHFENLPLPAEGGHNVALQAGANLAFR